jgi:hypothetical protein
VLTVMLRGRRQGTVATMSAAINDAPGTRPPAPSSRSAIRRLRSSRLSCCFLPLPSASATFARPFLK